MKHLTIFVDESPVGVGKTYNALAHALSLPARYLFVTERTRSVSEIETRVRGMAADRHRTITVDTITADIASRGRSVRIDVEALPYRYTNDEAHVIVIITHAAMMMSDLSQFKGWNIIVDEVPNILTQGKVRSKTDLDHFERNYSLKRISDDWSEVGLTPEGKALSGSDLTQCESHAHLRLFHQRVASGLRPVVCDLQEWKEMTGNDIEWTWWSLFTVRQLQAFDSIKFLGSGFMESVAAKMLVNSDPDVSWITSKTAGQRKLNPKRVNVHYFTPRRSSKFYFESEHGQEHLRLVGAYLAKALPSKAIWAANNPEDRDVTPYKVMEPYLHRITNLSPKQAGTSEYMRDYHDAAIIYASKPSTSSKAVLEALGCTEADWVETNEYETILQFLTRTSVRDVTTGGTTNLYVMSRDQADYLARFFDAQPHIDVAVSQIDLGFVFPEGEKRGPKVKILTPAEAAERKEKNRAAKAERERLRRLKAKGGAA